MGILLCSIFARALTALFATVRIVQKTLDQKDTPKLVPMSTGTVKKTHMYTAVRWIAINRQRGISMSLAMTAIDSTKGEEIRDQHLPFRNPRNCSATFYRPIISSRGEPTCVQRE